MGMSCLLAGLCACGQPPPADARKTARAAGVPAETYAAFPGAPEDFAGLKEDELQPYFALTQEALERWVLAMDITKGVQELPQFPLPMTPLLQKYTQLRFENDRQYIFYGTLLNIETSMGGGWPGGWEVIEGRLLCMPCVRVEFRYPGSDTDSGFGMGMQMLIENPAQPVLVDWFDPGKGSWDRRVREGHYDLPEGADPWAVYQWPAAWNLADPENWLGRCRLLGEAAEILD